MEFLKENIGTIIVALIVLSISGAIVLKLIKDKRAGRSSCGCGCENCANSQYCHGLRQHRTKPA